MEVGSRHGPQKHIIMPGQRQEDHANMLCRFDGCSRTDVVRGQLDGHIVVAGQVQVGVVALRLCDVRHAAKHVNCRLEVPDL